MAQIVCPLVSAEDRARLEAIVADRNRAQKHVARAQIILGSAERLNVAQIARRARIGRPAVCRWQRRFAEAGVDGLLRDATRKPGKAPLGDETVHRVVALTCAEPPGAATHWTGRAMARHTGVSLRSVQRAALRGDLGDCPWETAAGRHILASSRQGPRSPIGEPLKIRSSRGWPPLSSGTWCRPARAGAATWRACARAPLSPSWRRSAWPA